jgi:hypothetical protein
MNRYGLVSIGGLVFLMFLAWPFPLLTPRPKRRKMPVNTRARVGSAAGPA